MTPEGHRLDRTRCIVCGACVQPGCPALELIGRTAGVEEILEEVCRDRLYYQTSGGGVTLSGGEPLAQHAFARELLKACRREKIHTAVETCGCTSPDHLREIVPLTDLFLYDYKATDPEVHRLYTGADNRPLIANLRLLDQMGAASILRCPIIPGINDTPAHFSGIAQLASSLEHIREIQVEPYHPLGEGKARAIGREYAVPVRGFPGQETVADWIRTIAGQTAVPVRKA